jgi:hypothetical protein
MTATQPSPVAALRPESEKTEPPSGSRPSAKPLATYAGITNGVQARASAWDDHLVIVVQNNGTVPVASNAFLNTFLLRTPDGRRTIEPSGLPQSGNIDPGERQTFSFSVKHAQSAVAIGCKIGNHDPIILTKN